jgi:hypothetical protein
MIINFPAPPTNRRDYLTKVIQVIRDSFLSVVSKDQAVPHILLQSPDGTVYSITVSNAGTITATLNAGKVRP